MVKVSMWVFPDFGRAEEVRKIQGRSSSSMILRKPGSMSTSVMPSNQYARVI